MLRTIMLLSRTSKLSNIHPLEKAVLSIIPIVILGFTQNYIIVFCNILFFLFMNLIFKNNRKVFTKITLEVTAFAAISSITFVFDYGTLYTLTLILKSVSAGLCLSFFSLTTPIDDMLYCLGKKKYLKDICDIAKGMERFLVVINDEYRILYSSIKSRGGFDTFKLKIRNTGKMAALLFINTLNRWKIIKEGLDSRGYVGYVPYLDREFDFSYIRFFIIFTYIILMLLLVIFFK